MPEFTYPYTDDFMEFDEPSGHYILTEKALVEKAGLDVRARILATSTVNPETVVEKLRKTTSDMVYQYIHEFNVDNLRQDYLIAKIPELRPIVMKAMLYQAEHICFNGNGYFSPVKEDRQNAINELCKSVLNTVIPCLGASILYTGRL